MIPETKVRIEHHPRFVRARIEGPGGRVELLVEGPPDIVYRAIAGYFENRAGGRRQPQSLAEVFGG